MFYILYINREDYSYNVGAEGPCIIITVKKVYEAFFHKVLTLVRQQTKRSLTT